MSMYLPSHSLTSLTKICTCMFICILQCIYSCHYTPHSTNTLLYTYEVLPCTHRDALPFLQVKPAMLNMSTNEKKHLQPPLCTAYLAPRKVDGGCEPACLSCTTLHMSHVKIRQAHHGCLAHNITHTICSKCWIVGEASRCPATTHNTNTHPKTHPPTNTPPTHTITHTQ